MMKLIFELIIKPTSVFRKIKEENLSKKITIIYILVNILFIFVSNLEVFHFNQKNYLRDLIVVFGQFSIIKIGISFIIIVLIVYFSDLIAKNIGNKKEFFKLFNGLLLISVVIDILHIIVIFIPDITFSPNKVVPNGIIGLWRLRLTYILIQEIYNFSKGKTFLIFLIIIIPILCINYFSELYKINSYIFDFLITRMIN